MRDDFKKPYWRQAGLTRYYTTRRVRKLGLGNTHPFTPRKERRGRRD